jgi:hypothetical protein
MSDPRLERLLKRLNILEDIADKLDELDDAAAGSMPASRAAARRMVTARYLQSIVMWLSQAGIDAEPLRDLIGALIDLNRGITDPLFVATPPQLRGKKVGRPKIPSRELKRRARAVFEVDSLIERGRSVADAINTVAMALNIKASELKDWRKHAKGGKPFGVPEVERVLENWQTAHEAIGETDADATELYWLKFPQDSK